MSLKIAFGYRARSGKDTAVDYMISKYGGDKLAFAEPIYDILHYAQRICGFDEEKDREFLQYVGTSWGRAKDPFIWVNLCLDKSSDTGNSYVSDMRFRNEFDACGEHGYTRVKIVRDVQSMLHVSENDLDIVPDEDWDYIIYNNGTLDEFYEKINLMISTMLDKP